MNLDQVEPQISSIEQALEFCRTPFASIATRHHLAITQSENVGQQWVLLESASWDLAQDTLTLLICRQIG